MLSKKLLSLFLFLIILAPSSFADSIRISQIDTNTLLLNQQIRLYVSVTNDQGKPIENLYQNNFSLYESSNTKDYHQVTDITGFQAGLNYTNGVNFLLLIDNSESMYWTIEGKQTKDKSKRRISIAIKAVKAFLNSLGNRNDKVGIALYNSYYELLSKPIKDIAAIEQLLENIQRPKDDAIYSEIYGSVHKAVDDFNTVKGRKAIIILSDGVNNPSYNHTKKLNPQFGEKIFPHNKSLQALQLEGISLYVVNFGKKGDKKDRYLKKIGRQSGGMTFNAFNQNELRNVYLSIMDQIQKEYVLTYKATMKPADKKYVKIKYLNDSKKSTTTRFYLSSTVFGEPQKTFNPFLFISFLLACILLWVLSRLKFERQRAQPSIEVLNSGAGNISTQILTLGGEETIIGCSPNADMTIAGVPSIENNHATIVFDDKSHQYTLVGEGKMMVNNKIVTTKVLEPGDLINIDGTTMVFDEGTNEED